MKQTTGEPCHTQPTLNTIYRRYIKKNDFFSLNGNKEKVWLVILSAIPLTINQSITRVNQNG